jgi:hypothetical protein
MSSSRLRRVGTLGKVWRGGLVHHLQPAGVVGMGLEDPLFAIGGSWRPHPGEMQTVQLLCWPPLSQALSPATLAVDPWMQPWLRGPHLQGNAGDALSTP